MAPNIEINRTFANTVLAALLVGLLSIAGYMTVWNRDDHSHKQLVEERLLNIAARLSKIETAVEDGILPQARWRVDRLERYVDEIQKRLRDHEDEHPLQQEYP